MPDDAPLSVDTLYLSTGEAPFVRLVAAFYQQIPQDPLLGPMYPADDLAGAEQRLLDFLVFRCGGPARYLETRGHPKLRIRHAPFAVSPQARDHWLRLMANAFDTADWPVPQRRCLEDFLASVADFLINRPAG